MERIGFYAGSFDPFTKGHMAVVCEALQLFDKVIIAVGNNPNKNTMFDARRRMDMIMSSIQDFKTSYFHRYLSGAIFSPAEENVAERLCKDIDSCISIISYSGLTVDEALKENACCLIRGERMVGDHDSEMQQAMFNRELLNFRGSSMGIVFIPVPSTGLTYVSSGNVKSLCANGEYIVANKYVYPSVHKVLMEIYLKERFKRFLGWISRSPLELEKKWDKLIRIYNDPSRTYHNLSHVAYCLNIADVLTKQDSFTCSELTSIYLAIFYHDVVIKDIDAEEKSAAIFKKNTVKTKEVDNICQMIMATKIGSKYEGVSKDIVDLAKIVHDADVAILADRENYGLYAQQVRREYGEDTQEYAIGRIEVLINIKNNEIYSSRFGNSVWPDKAEENINREVAFWQSRL